MKFLHSTDSIWIHYLAGSDLFLIIKRAVYLLKLKLPNGHVNPELKSLALQTSAINTLWFETPINLFYHGLIARPISTYYEFVNKLQGVLFQITGSYTCFGSPQPIF